MIHLSKLTPALAAAAIGVLAMSPGAVAAPPSPQDLNPAPPDFYSCKTLGAGTICTGDVHEVKVSEPQHELVCGSGRRCVRDPRQRRGGLALHALVQRRRQPHQAGGARGVDRRLLEQPALRQDRAVHPARQVHDTCSPCRGTSPRPSRRQVGENIYTDPVTHKKVLHSVGRTVYGPDGPGVRVGTATVHRRVRHGDMSVFDPICAALS